MIGGGLGTSYSQWARREFTRLRHEGVKRRGPDVFRCLKEARGSRTFRRLTEEAGLIDLEVAGDGAADPDSSQACPGIWLQFRKKGEGI